MRKKTIGILSILSLILLIVGVFLFVFVMVNSPSVYDPYADSHQITSIGNVPLFISAIALYILGLVSFFVAWIAALIKLARLQQWTWFVMVIIFSWVCLIVYLFAGPETPKVAQYLSYPPRPEQFPQE